MNKSSSILTAKNEVLFARIIIFLTIENPVLGDGKVVMGEAQLKYKSVCSRWPATQCDLHSSQ